MVNFSVRRALVRWNSYRNSNNVNGYQTLRQTGKLFQKRKPLVADEAPVSSFDSEPDLECQSQPDVELDHSQSDLEFRSQCGGVFTTMHKKHHDDGLSEQIEHLPSLLKIGRTEKASGKNGKKGNDNPLSGHDQAPPVMVPGPRRLQRSRSCSSISFTAVGGSPLHHASSDNFGEIATIFVGEEWAPYTIRTDWLRAEVFRVLMRETKVVVGQRTDRIIHVGCDEVLFEHVLWLLSRSDPNPSFWGIDLGIKTLQKIYRDKSEND
ncbi:hypothetical protein CBR_g52549 [Chara braunii]|uniref:Uncharacterized protein n=1 Tax=Chara braunii TaxID=69332 RepID=A0A388MAH4_CHABU|nr:hypothetical protein CBR_g52549 [Chara braunii]|eukprot:GBG91515.1 hypothetical protein CBR_g52549 [Chara braunii]